MTTYGRTPQGFAIDDARISELAAEAEHGYTPQQHARWATTRPRTPAAGRSRQGG